MTTLADYIYEETALGNDEGDERFAVLNLTRAEWRQIHKALSEAEQWDSRMFPFLKERVPMASAARLLDFHTQATANAFCPDIAKAKRCLHELIARSLVQLKHLGD